MEVVSHQNVRLSAGCHALPGPGGVCAMELASMLAGEPFTDHPRSVSRSIAAVVRGYNDGLDDDRRQRLLGVAAACVGTRGTRAVERQRRRWIRDELAPVGDGWPVTVRLGQRLGFLSGYRVGRMVARQVVADDDDALHARTLALLDRLVALGGAGPGDRSGIDEADLPRAVDGR